MTLLITTAVFMVIRFALLVLNLMGVGMIAAAGANDPQNGQAMANAIGGTSDRSSPSFAAHWFCSAPGK